MSEKREKLSAVFVLFILIIVTAIFLGWSMYLYVDNNWKLYALGVLGVVILIYILVEIIGLARYFSVAKRNRYRINRHVAVELVLMNEQMQGIKTWDLRNKTGLIIGRSGDIDVDIDLSDTEYFSMISTQHAVLNYAEGSWYISDAGSKNGTKVLRGGTQAKHLLAIGEAVSIRPGDMIYIAEEVMLAVR